MAYFAVNRKDIAQPDVTFTYDDMIKPILAILLAHEKALEEQSNSLKEASLLAASIDKDRDPIAYATLLNYLQDLNRGVDNLNSLGYTPQTRKNIYKLKNRYAADIMPIFTALTTKKEQMKEQRENELKGIIYNTRAADTSLDYYIDNPNLEHKSANALASFTKLSSIFENLANLFNGLDAKHFDTFTWLILEKYGKTPQLVIDSINAARLSLMGVHSEKGDNIIKDIINQLIQSDGVNTWGNETARNQYFDFISGAAYNAIGKDKVDRQSDQGALLKAQEELQIRLANLGKNDNGNFSLEVEGIFYGDRGDYVRKDTLFKDQGEVNTSMAKLSKGDNTNKTGAVYTFGEGDRSATGMAKCIRSYISLPPELRTDENDMSGSAKAIRALADQWIDDHYEIRILVTLDRRVEGFHFVPKRVVKNQEYDNTMTNVHS